MHLFQPADCLVIETVPGTPRNAGDQRPLPQYDQFRITNMVGTAWGPNGVLSDRSLAQQGPDCKLSDLIDYSGEWMAVARQHGPQGVAYLVVADSYGYCPVFYSHIPGRAVVIAPSFHGVMAGLSQLNVGTSLDVAAYVSTLSGDHHYLTSHRTMAEEAKLLPADSALHITNSGVEVVPRAAVGGASAVDDYQEAISLGIEHASRSLKHLSEASETQKILTLSGGVDSRIAAALLQNAGVLHRFQVRTTDPRSWKGGGRRERVWKRDMAIAQRLRRDLGLPWECPGRRVAAQFSFRDALVRFQSYKSSYAYTFQPSLRHRARQKPIIAVFGGGGEILRSTTSGANAAAELNNVTGGVMDSQDALDWFVDQALLRSSVVEGYRSPVWDLMRSELEASQGGSFEEVLNDNYRRLRNRAHFGESRYRAGSNEYVFQPLSNAYLLRAAELIHFSERAAGKLVRDIFEIAPELLKYPFEDPEWDRALAQPDQHVIDDDDVRWQAELDEITAQAYPDVFEPGWEPETRSSNSATDVVQLQQNFLKQAFVRIEGMVPEHEAQPLRQQHELVSKKTPKGSPALSRAVAKAASALDALQPALVPGSCIFVSAGESELERDVVLGGVEITGLALPTVDYPVHTPVLEQTARGFRVSANWSSPDARVPNEYVFAFYLNRDDTRVATRWYEASDEAHFITKLLAGTYTATSFVRHQGRDIPTYIRTTPPVVVAG